MRKFNECSVNVRLLLSSRFSCNGRLFSAPITKVSNPENLTIRDEYVDEALSDPLIYIKMQQKYEYDLMEYESQLWEY